ncbi:hypothetical protein P2H44_22705 [Albimonas sp. CAU 1670]|uniref:hypothetical protein n=1 Tax=Albimonas sp. CAU 1670 TaxID=3032599 RepID=UPI0023DC10F1|nr:hypothetical protein [Albimonas sp. CAU 1670]MDF2235376.1 hypothetical protein [Albimonas sp. CAU 1670]
MPLPLIAAALAPVLASAAPSLLGHIMGPSGAAVGEAAVSVVEAVTGQEIRTPADGRRVAEILEANPQLLADLQVRLAELDVRELELANADRADARARDVALGGEGVRANVMLIAAFVGIVAIAGVWAASIIWAPPEAKAEVAGLMGFLSGIGGMFARNIGSAFDFEFGSSRGSREKTGALERLGRTGR